MEIILTSIATVRNSRIEVIDDNWETIITEIELADHIPTESLQGISEFSHLEIIYYFDKVENNKIVFSGRPRGNENYPIVGIFGQRKKDRTNKIGLTTVELLEHNNRTIKVKFLDAINGTPILDIKPVFKEFQPKIEIKQPNWVSDLMRNYWIANKSQMNFREAKVEDIKQIQIVRNSVKENTLSDSGLVTDEDCKEFMTERGKGWVCEIDNRIVGFAIADLKDNNIWALFLNPEFEGKGIGRTLHKLMLDWYFSQTKTTVWLGTAFNTRAESFYQKAGWVKVGLHGTKETKFEMTYDVWKQLS